MAMLQVAIFLLASAGLAYVSRVALRRPRSHGFWRFWAWEAIAALAEGSVITVDNGVKVLAALAAADATYRAELLPDLLHHLQTCRPKDVPQHAEAIVPAVDAAHADAFAAVLEQRLGNMSASQAARVKQVIAHARQTAHGSIR